MNNLEEHDEFKPSSIKETSNVGFYIKVVIAALLLGGGYFAFDRWGDQLFGSKKIKNDNGLDNKNVYVTKDNNKLLDTTASFNQIDTSSSINLVSSPKKENDSTVSKSFLKVNTKFDSLVIVKKVVNNISILNKYATDEAVFEALKNTDGYTDKKQLLLNKFRDNQIFSLETSLKLLAMSGLNILTNKKTDADLTLLSLIKDQKNLSNFYIIDKDGIIYYDAKNNMTFSRITDITNSLALSANYLEVSEDSGQIILSYPIYHTFGKIGFVVLMLKNGVN
jgi:hypothetical protein